MSFYQSTRQMKAAVIGSIIPWSGQLSTIPDGWIICDGTQPAAKDYPLLVQAIGDTYNEGTSNLGGAFPNYTGSFKLPDLLGGRTLMDIEGSYFATAALGGTGSPIDTDPDARTIIEPYIGSNTDNGMNTVWNDVRTDVEFTLNVRNGYVGNISGNTIIPGQGEKTVFIGGRKLGHQHIRDHSHPGSYETILDITGSQPGFGVIPYDNITAVFNYASIDVRTYVLGVTGGDFQIDKVRFGLEGWFKDNVQLKDAGSMSSIGSFSGFGSGSDGRAVAKINSEIPPSNLAALNISDSPLATWGEWRPLPSSTSGGPTLSGGDEVPYGLFGQSTDVPQGYRNFYPDVPAAGRYSTFVSNEGSDFLGNDIQAHGHDPFQVVYDQNSLKPQPRLDSNLTIPIDTVLDNVSNKGALQINMNTAQPTLTCVYIIRAY